MNRLYTEETLIQFYYEECDLLDKFEIENVLETDLESNLQYSLIYQEIQSLRGDLLSPKNTSLINILEYSKK
jgi:hypothetical protein